MTELTHPAPFRQIVAVQPEHGLDPRSTDGSVLFGLDESGEVWRWLGNFWEHLPRRSTLPDKHWTDDMIRELRDKETR